MLVSQHVKYLKISLQLWSVLICPGIDRFG